MIRVHERPTFPKDADDLGYLPEDENCHILYMSLCGHCCRSRWSWQRSPCAERVPYMHGAEWEVKHSAYGTMSLFLMDPVKPKRFLVPVVRWLRLPKDLLMHIQSYLAMPELNRDLLIERRDLISNLHYELNGYYGYHRDYGIYGNFYRCGQWSKYTGIRMGNVFTVSKKRKREIESHWMAETLTGRARSSHYPLKGSLLGLYEDITSIQVMLPHEGMIGNPELYRRNVSHKEKLDAMEKKLTPKIFREGLELFGMFYLNGDQTRLYFHYPGDALK